MPSMGSPKIEVRKADGAEVRSLSRVLARAFYDDPLTLWMFPTPDARKRRLPVMFRALMHAALSLDEVYTTRDLRGAAFWNPPGTFPYDWSTNARVGLTVSCLLGLRLAHCARGLLFFDRHRPKEPHWYLQMLGTEPEYQGRGVGSALLSTVLERCDRTGERVYLEASKEKNVPFYARHGFVVSEEMHVPKGPTVWAMWRDPH